jgi:hypothetical protein
LRSGADREDAKKDKGDETIERLLNSFPTRPANLGQASLNENPRDCVLSGGKPCSELSGLHAASQNPEVRVWNALR